MDSEINGVLYVKYEKSLIDKGFELKYAKPGDVGIDLPVIMDDRLKLKPSRDYYINEEQRWFDIPPNGLAEIPCGLSVKVPDDAWANIKPRSSTAWKKRLVVFEAVIDSGYTGPLYILVNNPQSEPVRVHEWDRLAQLIIIPKYRLYEIAETEGIRFTYLQSNKLKIEAKNELPTTARSDSGFGSSGGVHESNG